MLVGSIGLLQHRGQSIYPSWAHKVALGYGLAVLLVAVLCIPYWKWLHLIP